MWIVKLLSILMVCVALNGQLKGNNDENWQSGNLKNSAFDSKIGWVNTPSSPRYFLRSATSLKDGHWIAAIVEHQSKEDSNGFRTTIEWRIIAAEVNGKRRKQLTFSNGSNYRSRVVRLAPISSTELMVIVEPESSTKPVAAPVIAWNIPDDKIEEIEAASIDEYRRRSRLDFWLCFGKDIRAFQSESRDQHTAYFESGVGFQNRFFSQDQDGVVSTISPGFELNSAICASNKLEAVVGIEFGKSEPSWKIDRTSLSKYVELTPSTKLRFWTAYSQKPFEMFAPVFARIDDELHIIVLQSGGAIQKVVPTNLRYLASSPYVSLDGKSVYYFAYGDDVPTRHLASMDLERKTCSISEGYSTGLCHIDDDRVYGFSNEGLVAMDRMKLRSNDFLWLGPSISP